VPDSSQVTQVLLSSTWRSIAEAQKPLPTFDQAQFRAYSQNGEDGLLLLLFSVIGTTNKEVVEICAGTGVECNAANLIVNHGWRGLLVDGDAKNLAIGRDFYSNHPTTRIVGGPTLKQAWITTSNVNRIVRQAGFTGDIDLLSMDIDGNDYWILSALTEVRPRAIVLEYQTAWGPDNSLTQRYEEDFHISQVAPNRSLPRCGASLAAFNKLLKARGYRLVGKERNCFNAFFLRDDVGQDHFPEVPVSECFDHPSARFRILSRQSYADELVDMWEEV
jgi:hypothetical protein